MSKQKRFDALSTVSSKPVARAGASVVVAGGVVAGLVTTMGTTGSNSASAAPEVSVSDAHASTQQASPRPDLDIRKTAPSVSVAHADRVQVSRSQARQALTAPAAKPVKAVKRAAVKPVTAKTAATTTDRHSVRRAAGTKPATPQRTHAVAQHRATPTTAQATALRPAATQRTVHAPRTQQASTEHRVSRTAARQTVTTHRTPVQHAVAHRTTATHAATAAHQAPRTVAAKTSATTYKASSAQYSGSSVLAIAAANTGVPYVVAGSSPAGFDCSGYVQYVLAKAGIHVPHQSGAIKAMTTPVSNPRPGDLAFLPGHVAIYAGNGKVYEARHPGTVTGLYPVLPGTTFGRL